jgi:hypothetical protein
MESAAEAAFGFRSLPLQVTLPRRSIVSARPGAVLAKGEETCVKADFAHQARWGAVQHSRLPSSPSRRPINTIR